MTSHALAASDAPEYPKIFIKPFSYLKNFPKESKNPLDSATITVYIVYMIDMIHKRYKIHMLYLICTVSVKKDPLHADQSKNRGL